MKRRKDKYGLAKTVVLALTLAAVLTVAFAAVVYAADGSWISGRDNLEIYKSSSGIKSTTTSFLQELGEGVNELLDTVLGRLIAPFIAGIGDALNLVLATAGASLNTIIFGKVGGYVPSGKPSLFNFGFEKGNIYGTVSMAIYSALMGIFIIIIICVIVAKLCKLLFVSNDPKAVPKVKQTLLTAILCLALMYLMPKLMDILYLVRDYILYGIMNRGTNLVLNAAPDLSAIPFSVGDLIATNPLLLTQKIIGCVFGADGEMSLSHLYRQAYLNHVTVFNAIMYLGSVILTLYFSFTYVAIAFSVAILVVLFPFIAVIDLAMGGTRMKDWLVEMLGLMMVPIIDAVLLLFPLAVAILGAGSAGSGLNFLQFILMASIIPARKFVRSKLSLGNAYGLEGAGIGSMLGAVRLGMAVAGAAKGMVSAARAGKDAAQALAGKGEAATRMAEANEKAGGDALKAFGADSRNIGHDENIAKTGFKAVDDKKIEGSFKNKKMTSNQRNVARADAIRKNINDAHKSEREIEKMRNDNEKAVNDEISGIQAGIDLRSGQQRKLGEEMERDQQEIKKLEEELKSPGLEQNGKNIPAGLTVDDMKNGQFYNATGQELAVQAKREQIARLKGNVSKNRNEINRLKGMNESARGQVQELQRKKGEDNARYAVSLGNLRDLQSSGREQLRELSRNGGDTDLERQEAFDAMASIDNYELPEINKNLSAERLAELRSAHAAKARSDSKRQVIMTGIGAGYGGLLGSAATVLGAPAGMMAAGAGIQLGEMAGAGIAESIARNKGAKVNSGMTAAGNAGPAPIGNEPEVEIEINDKMNNGTGQPQKVEVEYDLESSGQGSAGGAEIVKGGTISTGKSYTDRLNGSDVKGFVSVDDIERFNGGDPRPRAKGFLYGANEGGLVLTTEELYDKGMVASIEPVIDGSDAKNAGSPYSFVPEDYVLPSASHNQQKNPYAQYDQLLAYAVSRSPRETNDMMRSAFNWGMSTMDAFGTLQKQEDYLSTPDTRVNYEADGASYNANDIMREVSRQNVRVSFENGVRKEEPNPDYEEHYVTESNGVNLLYYGKYRPVVVEGAAAYATKFADQFLDSDVMRNVRYGTGDGAVGFEREQLRDYVRARVMPRALDVYQDYYNGNSTDNIAKAYSDAKARDFAELKVSTDRELFAREFAEGYLNK